MRACAPFSTSIRRLVQSLERITSAAIAGRSIKCVPKRQPASARRSAIKYNETGFAVLRADASMCNVQRKYPETCDVFSTKSLERIASAAIARRSIKFAPKRVSCGCGCERRCECKCECECKCDAHVNTSSTTTNTITRFVHLIHHSDPSYLDILHLVQVRLILMQDTFSTLFVACTEHALIPCLGT